MFVWTGAGWIAGVISVGALLGVKSWVESHHGADDFYGFGPQALVIVLAVVPCFFLGRWLNRGQPPRFLDAPRSVWNAEKGALDHYPPTGHTFAFIRLEYAGVLVLLVLALLWLERGGVFG